MCLHCMYTHDQHQVMQYQLFKYLISCADFEAYLVRSDMEIPLNTACRLSDYQCKNLVRIKYNCFY